MNIEKLNGSRKKKTIVLVLVFLVVTITLILVTSMAKYKNVQSMDLASGIINYIPADIDIVSINIENESGSYESSTTIPTSGYTLSNTSYCNVNGTKDPSIKITYENGLVGISDITKKTKCTLYFNKPKAIDKIIGDTTGIQEKTSFTGIATASDTGIYSAPDDYGTSYYFRGLEGSLNNWVKFAGFYWRIIRVNGNGTIRMIYQGTANGNISSSNKIGETTQIGKSMYNHTYNDNAYVGYMMGIPLNGTEQTANTTSSNSTSYEQAHTNTYDSDAKIQVDSWYKTNIEDKGLGNYVDANTGFCCEREISKKVSTSYQGDGYGIQQSAYAPYEIYEEGSKYKTTQKPTFQCSNKSRDLFTQTSANIGNKKLIYSVGLITSDEAIFAGNMGGYITNTTNYLYTNQYYWTMSPSQYNGNNAYVFGLHSGGLVGWSVHTKNSHGLRPVLNLRADTTFTGEGSETSPFVVVAS